MSHRFSDWLDQCEREEEMGLLNPDGSLKKPLDGGDHGEDSDDENIKKDFADEAKEASTSIRFTHTPIGDGGVRVTRVDPIVESNASDSDESTHVSSSLPGMSRYVREREKNAFTTVYTLHHQQL